MGFEPTIFPVTGGRVNRATPRPHIVRALRSFSVVMAVVGIGHNYSRTRECRDPASLAFARSSLRFPFY